MPMTFPFSFWLIPEKKAYTQLEGHIKTICQQYAATPFLPHVTLLVGEHQQNEDMVELGGRLADEVTAIPLKLQKIDYSDFFFKTLFLQFAPHPSLTKLVQIMQNAIQNHGEYQFDPHLSLIYAKMPSKAQQSLAQSIQLDAGTFLFDRLSLATLNPKTHHWDDIAGWQIQQTWSLSDQL